MNRVLIIISAFYLILSACNKNGTTASNDSGYPPIDTLKNAAIDTIMYQVGRKWMPGPHYHAIGLNETDTVKYIDVDGYPGRISSTFYTDSTATWITAIQSNNELVLMRFREFRQFPQPKTQETISYFENGKIYYSRERTRLLQEGEQIGAFRDAEFVENARPPEALMAEYMPYWEISQATIKKDYESRKSQ